MFRNLWTHENENQTLLITQDETYFGFQILRIMHNMENLLMYNNRVEKNEMMNWQKHLQHYIFVDRVILKKKH